MLRAVHPHRGIVIVHPQQVDHHRWSPPASSLTQPGLVPFDASMHAMLRQLGWRRPPRNRRLLALALVAAVLLHVLFGVVLWRGMMPPASLGAAAAQAGGENVLEVRFITRAAPAPAAPAPPPMPSLQRPAPRATPATHEPPARDAMRLQLPAAASTAAAPRLFDRDGQPLLPAATASVPPAPGYVEHLPAGDARIMRHREIVTYRPTRFDKDWSGGGNAVDNALQKLVDKTTVKHTFHLPGGVRIHCAVFLLAGGCAGEPPPPPSAKDGDERLDMAPATPLAADPHAAAPPSVAACIAMYRAGRPLAWGCPVDTPDRAIDQELRERAAKPFGKPSGKP